MDMAALLGAAGAVSAQRQFGDSRARTGHKPFGDAKRLASCDLRI